MCCTVLKTDNSKKAAPVIEEKLNISDYKVIDNNEIRIYDSKIKIENITKVLVENNIAISGIYEYSVSLEDYFKSLVGEAENV